MIEFNDALEAVHVIQDDFVYVYWAPSDATRYRVSLVSNVCYGGFDTLNQEHDVCYLAVLLASSMTGLMIERPSGEGTYWTADRFLRKFGPDYAGWWAGVRPLLAALGWTTPECASMNYDQNDANEMARLVGEYE